MQPFLHSFVRVGERYYAETGERLEFFPLTIHGAGNLVVGKPVVFNPLNQVGMERRRLKELMEDTITAIYINLEGGNASGTLTAERK
jgi:acyl-[acyl carrier protein]--UDP-N-acetylglucosamine O-acyltransferase